MIMWAPYLDHLIGVVGSMKLKGEQLVKAEKVYSSLITARKTVSSQPPEEQVYPQVSELVH